MPRVKRCVVDLNELNNEIESKNNFNDNDNNDDSGSSEDEDDEGKKNE